MLMLLFGFEPVAFFVVHATYLNRSGSHCFGYYRNHFDICQLVGTEVFLHYEHSGLRYCRNLIHFLKLLG